MDRNIEMEELVKAIELRSDKIKYINFMMWFRSDTSHLNYDPVIATEKYIEFITLPLNGNNNE